MADIKIKETAKTVIKTAEKVGIVSDKVKEAGIKTKERINKAVENRSDSPNQYATDKVQERQNPQRRPQLMNSANRVRTA